MKNIRPLIWGADSLYPIYATEQFLVAGATGSGKTVLINMLMRSALEGEQPVRGMVFDPKQESLPYIYGMVNKAERVRVLHPLDRRSCAWDIAADIDGPVTARQFASILMPNKEAGHSSSGGSADDFFDAATRDLLVGVLEAFIRCVPAKGTWTFRDVMLTMLYEPYLDFILGLDTTRDKEPFPYSSRLRQAYLRGDERTKGNIRASISANLSVFEPIAALWHHAQEDDGQTFSLKQWLKDGCFDVLVLGNDEAARDALDPINRAIFRRASELMLARRELSEPEKQQGKELTWFFLDEVREAGHLEGLSRLLTKGRSKGACIVIGFQDFDGMRAAYGDEITREICGQCSNIAILKLSSPSTAEWCVELFGRRLAQAEGATRGIGSDGNIQEGQNISQEERPYLYSADFLYLPKTSSRDGLHGFFKGSYRRVEEGFYEFLPWNEAIDTFLPRQHPGASDPDPSVACRYSAFWPRPVEQQYLKPWDQKDWERLGLHEITPQVIAWNAEPHQRPNVDTREKRLGNARNKDAA